MSLDYSVHLFFPIGGAAGMLRALRAVLNPIPPVLTIVLPGGESIQLPANSDGGDTETLEPGGEIGFDAEMVVVRRRKRRTARPVVDKWGDAQYFRIIKEREEHQISCSLDCGREFFEFWMSNVTNDLRLFESNAFRAHVGAIFAAGHGVGGSVSSQGEWYTLDETRALDLADFGADPEPDVDGRARILQRVLGSPGDDAE